MKETRTGSDRFKHRPSAILRGKATQIILKVKKLWAEWMAKKTASLSPRKLYIILVLFVCIGTTYNTLILTGLWKVKNVVHGNIAIPKGSIRRDFADSLMMTQRGVQDLKVVQSSIDSLKSTKKGRAILDSIAKHRPGLLDSVRAVEQMLTKY